MDFNTWRAFPEKNPIRLWEQTPGFDPSVDQDEPTITPYLLEGPGRGCVIVFPGGGYWLKAGHEAEPIAQAINALQCSAFVLDYRVQPYHDPYPLMDAQRAVRFVRAHAEEYGINPERIAVLGFSAGGHLAACSGVFWDEGNPDAADPVERVSCRPDAMALCYPVVDLTGDARHAGSARNLLGDRSEEEAARAALSPQLHVTDRTPPAFLWHTADDEGVSCRNSEMMFRALRDHGVTAELHIFSHGVHGLGLAPMNEHVGSWTRLLSGFLIELGF